VTSHVTARFRNDFTRLPKRIQEQARRAYRQFKSDPDHPSLAFKKLPPHSDIWSVRISEDYRAVGRRQGDLVIWFFIGSHSQYDAQLSRL
jgi:mRNA-degrading endonuclease RelE of RelBE toxin-antitoxin system